MYVDYDRLAERSTRSKSVRNVLRHGFRHSLQTALHHADEEREVWNNDACWALVDPHIRGPWTLFRPVSWTRKRGAADNRYPAFLLFKEAGDAQRVLDAAPFLQVATRADLQRWDLWCYEGDAEAHRLEARDWEWLRATLRPWTADLSNARRMRVVNPAGYVK